jgi:magnesium transporter
MAIPRTKKEKIAAAQGVRREDQLNIETITYKDLTWVNIEQPAKRETEYLAQHYPFHPLDLDDCLSRIQRPKIDEYKDYLFLVLHFPIYNKATRVATHTQVSVFIGGKYLITLHTGQLKPLVTLFRKCQIDDEARQEYLGQSPGYLLYRIIDRLVDAYFPILDKILSLMEDVEDTVFDEKVESAQELAILRRDIITQRRIVFPMRTVIAMMESKLDRFTKTDRSVYFGDLMDHMNKICETLDECKEVIEVFKDADFVLSAEYVNRIVRIMTILATIMLPFLVGSSIYGMNIHLPGGLTSGSFLSFIVLVVLMALITAGMLYFFHRKRWI